MDVQESFDFVRLTPHFAQDDNVGNSGEPWLGSPTVISRLHRPSSSRSLLLTVLVHHRDTESQINREKLIPAFSVRSLPSLFNDLLSSVPCSLRPVACSPVTPVPCLSRKKISKTYCVASKLPYSLSCELTSPKCPWNRCNPGAALKKDVKGDAVVRVSRLRRKP